MPNLKPSIPYPSRHDNEKRRDQANEKIEKFYEIFKDMSFEISFTDALILMPKFASTLKALIGNKEKLSEMARTTMNEHCSAVILNKLPRKLGDPGKFLIPCEFSVMDECLALADLSTSINLMPLSVWEGLSLPELTPTFELSDRMSVLQCQLITHVGMFNARYDHSLRNVERLSKQYAQQTQTIKRQRVDLKQQNESTVRANEEVSRLTAELGALKFLKSGEFNRAFVSLLNTTICIGVERGLRLHRTDEEFRGLSQRVAGFILDAKEKFDRVVAAFPDTTFLFLDKVSQNSQSSLQDIARLEPDRMTSSHQTSSATIPLRANTHVRRSTSSSKTFGHTSTPKHLKKKKKFVEKGAIHRRVFIMREKEKCLFPSLMLQSQIAEVAQPNHQWHQFHHWGHISRSHPIHTEVGLEVVDLLDLLMFCDEDSVSRLGQLEQHMYNSPEQQMYNSPSLPG
nr:reverse transcriptase domain-containing protein [Tanacetum cinerariifolium]